MCFVLLSLCVIGYYFIKALIVAFSLKKFCKSILADFVIIKTIKHPVIHRELLTYTNYICVCSTNFALSLIVIYIYIDVYSILLYVYTLYQMN